MKILKEIKKKICKNYVSEQQSVLDRYSQPAKYYADPKDAYLKNKDRV